MIQKFVTQDDNVTREPSELTTSIEYESLPPITISPQIISPPYTFGHIPPLLFPPSPYPPHIIVII